MAYEEHSDYMCVSVEKYREVEYSHIIEDMERNREMIFFKVLKS